MINNCAISFMLTLRLPFVCQRVGEKVPFAKKGRFGVVSGSVEEFFSPFHLQVETSTIDDLAESHLMQKVSWHFEHIPCC
jgi:hypothetical protein